MLKIVLLSLGALVLVTGVFVWYAGAQRVDMLMNRVVVDPTAPVPTAADLALHRSLFIADLHADTLKWNRDLLKRSDFGHLDVPRLVDGNVGLQVFTIVTKGAIPQSREDAPGGMCVSGERFNTAAVLAVFQGRPVFSLRERAFLQVRRLKDAAERSRESEGPELRLIETADDLRRLVADREAGEQVIGAILGIEGGHWVGDDADEREEVDEDMRELFEAGVRMFAPTHRFDNALSGSSEGCERYGLTTAGRRALEVAQELRMAVDLAHISPKGLRDALAMLSEPVLVSHTGVKAGCEPPCRPPRNLSDEEIALLAENGGLIGVGFWPQAIGSSAWGIADAMEHIMNIERERGLEPGRHVALGSDFDGMVTPYFDVSDLATLTTIMRRRDQPFDEGTIRDIAGQNVCRYFARVLPGGSREAAREICPDVGSEVPTVELNVGSALL